MAEESDARIERLEKNPPRPIGANGKDDGNVKNIGERKGASDKPKSPK